MFESDFVHEKKWVLTILKSRPNMPLQCVFLLLKIKIAQQQWNYGRKAYGLKERWKDGLSMNCGLY